MLTIVILIFAAIFAPVWIRWILKASEMKPATATATKSGNKKFIPQKTVHYVTPSGNVWSLFEDILSQPHTLIAGATGSGKSVAMNGLIDTILYDLPFDKTGNSQMILIDPKRVELARYKNLPHVLEYASGQNPDAWSHALQSAVRIMDKRYDVMESRGILDYDGSDLYVFIDEWASINSKYNTQRSNCVASLLRLVSEGRAAKVHVILATQVPKANIIPTEIRDNFTARLALMTENKLQSRVIIDTDGCETFPSPKKAGYAHGMYCLPGNDRTLYKVPYVQQEEIQGHIDWWYDQMRQNGIDPATA